MSVSVVNSTYVSISGGTSTGTATAACPGGTVAVSGGYEVHPTTGASDRFEKMNVVRSRPTANGLGWEVVMHSSSTGSDYTFRAVVLCS